jgi:hypothetical protein
MARTTPVAVGALALALCVLANPARATSTSGWSQADISAAKIRELQTRLMVAALRCRAGGIDILASYNRFVGADRDQLRAANDRLKAHFMAAGAATGERDYDRYTTALANSYGASQWGPGSCEQAARLADDAIAARGKLIAVAERAGDGAGESFAQAAAPAMDDRSSFEAYADRGSPRGYDDRDRGRGYRDDRASPQAYDDRAPPPGYDDRGPRGYDDDRVSAQAYNDRAPPPGYRDWGPPPGYDDRAAYPAYEDRGPPPGYGD